MIGVIRSLDPRLLLAVACVGANACNDSTRQATVVHLADSAGFHVLRLRSGISSIGADAGAIQPDLTVGTAEDLGRVADVVPWDDGSFTVVDMQHRSLLTYDSDGRLKSRVPTGGGDSTALFKRPVAAVRVAGHLVVLNQDSLRQFVRLDPEARSMRAVPRPVAGDWDMFAFRGPLLLWEWPLQHGYEDWPLRLQSFGDSGFVHQVQPSEAVAWAAGQSLPQEGPLVSFVRYSASMHVIDTLATVPGAPTAAGTSTHIADFRQDIFVARPVWAASNAFFALAAPGASAIVVRFAQTRPPLRIEWPLDSSRVTKDDRREAMRWQMGLLRLALPDFDRRMRRVRWWGRRAWVSRNVHQFSFALRRPQLTAAYAGGSCLWLAGFSSSDTPQGASLSLVGIDVHNARLLGAVRVPVQGSRIRRISATDVFVAPPDGPSAARAVQRYPLPPHIRAACALK